MEGCKNFMDKTLLKELDIISKANYLKNLDKLTSNELHSVISKFVMGKIAENWSKSKLNYLNKRKVCYFSAEFLIGRMIHNNLFALGILESIRKILLESGIDIDILEDVQDAALGSGGLGRLAACFLDSAATHNIPLYGYGIRYKYGLFKQVFEDGIQKEIADDWQKFGDPWSIPQDEQYVIVNFADYKVKAVPYDLPIIGFNTDNINTLRLWQSEPINKFDFEKFNNHQYSEIMNDKNKAEEISMVLYPNDSTINGKKLRLRQQYFFTSASIQDIIRQYKSLYGKDFSKFSELYAIQLNDTHPVISIPELIRLLMLDGLSFEDSFKIAQNTFSYTNHTIMEEAMEKWSSSLVQEILPDIYDIIININERLIRENSNLEKSKIEHLKIICDDLIHMARLANYVCSHINGVAKVHTNILKSDVFKIWYELYPQKFQNKTNGITQRRWLGLCNPHLSSLITELIGDGWLTELSKINKLDQYLNDESIINKINSIKLENKKTLCDYIQKIEHEFINPNFIFDVQIKRLHEYKRQLLNAFSIMYIYFRIKDGTLKDFPPTAFIFGAKAAPGYRRAKTIIKYINEIKKLINNDPEVNDKMKVVFVSNYNVSYAEKIIPAADISEQISTAGTEASGTGNMKLMLNGAVTLGTLDGANIEIVNLAGVENNYIFGAKVDEINNLKHNYCPETIYENNEYLKRIINTLIDDTFSLKKSKDKLDFKDLFDSLLNNEHNNNPDAYFVLYDFESYVESKLRAIYDYNDRTSFGKKCLKNIASAGFFSSDRTIREYAKDIWNVW